MILRLLELLSLWFSYELCPKNVDPESQLFGLKTPFVSKALPLPFLLTVMTDRVATRLAVRNATCIINYEFPVNKIDFGQRLGCLLDSMRNKVSEIHSPVM